MYVCVYWTSAIRMDLRNQMFRHHTWHQHSLHQSLTPFIFWNCTMAFCMWRICGRGLARAVRGCDRAPRFIRCSQSTTMMWWFAENMVKCAHIECEGLINNISQFSHPSQILVFSRMCFHVINRMEVIYLCLFWCSWSPEEDCSGPGNQNINVKRSWDAL